MFMKGLKLEYQVSQGMSNESNQIIDLIILSLQHKNYMVESITGSNIIFDGKPGKANFKRLGEGEIEIMHSDNASMVELKYYVNLLPPLVFFLFPLTFGIMTGIYVCPIVFAVALSIQEIVRIQVW